MKAILQDLPFYEEDTPLHKVGGEAHLAKAYQIVFWASITSKGAHELPERATRFPLILSTGHNQCLSINKDHLWKWALLEPEQFPAVQMITYRGSKRPLVSCDLWLHPNLPGQRDKFHSTRKPFCLELDNGITVIDKPGEPRLPVLGMRALSLNSLHLAIDFTTRRVQLKQI